MRMCYQAIAALAELRRNAMENVSQVQASVAQDPVTHADSLVTF